MSNATKISLVLVPVVIMITLVIGISRGVSDLNEQVQVRHESIPAAIQHLLK